jgi:N-methylhydantoinase A
VGGTSFDTCLIADGRVNVKYEGSIDGMPLQTRWVDVRSIGAGGGSIASIDQGGLLRVGPRSAGAVPGPVCYGRGGNEPTVTDAAAVLGMLGFGELAAGLRLDVDAARSALEPLAAGLSLSPEGVARGIMTIASAAMANAIRSVTIEQGRDTREAALIAFGGAGPLFGTLLSRELEVATVVIPRYAGNFSAWGLLGQDIRRSAALTSIHPLNDEGIVQANAVLRSLYSRIDADGSGVEREAALDLRYEGQEYTLTVVAPSSATGEIDTSAAVLEQLFVESYERTFGHVLEQAVEIVSTRATARTPLPRRVAAPLVPGASDGRLSRKIEAYSFRAGESLAFEIVNREALGGRVVAGPLIVLENTTTTYVDAGFDVSVHPTGALVLTDRALSDR